MYIVFAFHHRALVSPHFSSAMMAMALAGLRAAIRALVDACSFIVTSSNHRLTILEFDFTLRASALESNNDKKNNNN